jgi:hypothetical protein
MRDTTLTDVKNYIEGEVFRITDPRMDGYSTWPRKQRLYELKFYLDEMLKACPTYTMEKDWLEEQHMLKVQKILEGKKTP